METKDLGNHILLNDSQVIRKSDLLYNGKIKKITPEYKIKKVKNSYKRVEDYYILFSDDAVIYTFKDGSSKVINDLKDINLFDARKYYLVIAKDKNDDSHIIYKGKELLDKGYKIIQMYNRTSEFQVPIREIDYIVDNNVFVIVEKDNHKKLMVCKDRRYLRCYNWSFDSAEYLTTEMNPQKRLSQITLKGEVQELKKEGIVSMDDNNIYLYDYSCKLLKVEKKPLDFEKMGKISDFILSNDPIVDSLNLENKSIFKRK